MTANYEYSHSNTENLPLPVQMQLSKKLWTFFQFFIAILQSPLNFKHFEKKWASRLKYFWSYRLPKTCLLKCIKGLVSENSLPVNVLSSAIKSHAFIPYKRNCFYKMKSFGKRKVLYFCFRLFSRRCALQSFHSKYLRNCYRPR